MLHDLINSPALMALVGFLVFVLVFRGKIADLLGRITKVGKTGIETASPMQQGQQKAGTSASSKFEDFDSISNEVLRPYYALFESEMVKRNITSSEERELFFKKTAAGSAARWGLERLYYYIYGSQINALEFMASLPLGVAESDLAGFYETGKTQAPQLYASLTFQNWLTYLTGSNLVILDQGNYKITITGKEFLKYMVDANHTKFKPG